MTDCPSGKSSGEEEGHSGYTIEWPKKSVLLNLIMVGLAALLTVGLVSGSDSEFWLAIAAILILIVVVSAIADLFFTIPIAVGRSLRLPANLEWIARQTAFGSRSRIFISVLKHSAGNVATWICLIVGAAYVNLPFDMTKGGEISLSLIPIVGPFVIWFFLLESGIASSLIVKAQRISIPVHILWSASVFTTSVLTGLRFGEYLVISPIAAHVDTKYVPNYWQDDIGGIPEMQVKIIIVVVLIAWIITGIVSVFLFNNLAKKARAAT